MQLQSVQFSASRVSTAITAVAFWIMLISGQPAWALITGGEGNDPVRDPGWPKGAAEVFNTKSRVAFWEGPPFGGGQHHAECRGDTDAFQRVLDDFAKIDSPFIRIVLHDGVGHSFWLNTNPQPNKLDQAKIDWIFMVWQPERRKMQRQLPVGMSAIGKRDPAILAQLDVYTGGSIRWKDVKVPAGLDVIDQRLESHGFQLEDGTVLEGRVTDVATSQPMKATFRLERIESEKGGYVYTKLEEVQSNADGRWVLKNAPKEWCRLILAAEGYAPRVIGYARFDGQPQWSEYNFALSKPGIITGRVVDDKGKPLAEVNVRADEVDVKQVGGYQSPGNSTVMTDKDGHFTFDSLPIGSTSVHVHKTGYVGPGLGMKIEIPVADLELKMQLAAKLRVSVDFSGTKRPNGYMVHYEPEGGEQIGKWSGSADINEQNEFTFADIPAGKYVVWGRPNPGGSDQQTDAIAVDLTGGKTSEVKLKSK